MTPWDKWQGELLDSLQSIITYSNLGLVFSLDMGKEISVDQEEKDLHLSIKAMTYRKHFNSISPPRWTWNDSIARARSYLMVFINDWLRMKGLM